MEIEVEGETEVDCICPKCKHKFSTLAHYNDTVEIDPPDYDWRD